LCSGIHTNHNSIFIFSSYDNGQYLLKERDYMFSEEFEQEMINAVREIVKDILQDEIKQDKRYNQKELCETLGIGVDTLSDLNKRGLRPTKVGRQYIYLESEVNKFLKENTI